MTLLELGLDPRPLTFTRVNGSSTSADLSSAGAGKAITFVRMPYGLAVGNYVRISGGAGTAEAAQISAVSGTAGGAGTVTVTTANVHTGAWTVASATAGISEAFAFGRLRVVVNPGAYSIYGTITIPADGTLEGPAALYDSNPAPATLNWIPLTGSMIVVSADHVTIRGLTLYGGTSGTPSTSIGIDVSGVAPRAAITFQLYDVYVNKFNVGILADSLTNSRAQAVACYNNVSHGIWLKNVQGQWADLFSQTNGGDAIKLDPTGLGSNATPFLIGVHTHDNQGWGINSTVALNLTKFYLNFDKAGEINYNFAAGLPGTVTDGHIEQAGNSPTYGVNNVAPGIRVSNTSGLAISNVQFNTNQGNAIELNAGLSSVSNCWLLGNGLGAQAGFTHNILSPAAGSVVTGNISSGTMSFSGAFSVVNGNVMGGNSANPILNFAATATGTIAELNSLNNAGAGTALTAIANSTFQPPFNNTIVGGTVANAGAVFIQKEYVAPNCILTETGSNNAIAGALIGVPLTAGLRITVKLAHSLQIGVNTFALNGVAKSIIRHTTGGNLAASYAANLFIEMIYDGASWQDLGQ